MFHVKHTDAKAQTFASERRKEEADMQTSDIGKDRVGWRNKARFFRRRFT